MVECNRTMEQARRDVASGRITHASVLRQPMTSQWTIRLAGKHSGTGMLLAVETLTPQCFGSLDGAVAAGDDGV